MLLSAFLDLGWQKKRLRELPMLLNLQDIEIEISERVRGGIKGAAVDIISLRPRDMRDLQTLTGLINASSLPPHVSERSISCLTRLAEAEARIHGCTIHDIHFHEIGAADTIIDITGTLLALKDLAIDKIFCSPLPLARGFVKCSHGNLPLPAPAVLDLLKGIPVYSVDESAELVTPTGAALLMEIADSFGPMPEMKILETGYGAGTRKLQSMPNILRVILGEGIKDEVSVGTISEIKTVIDDMTPEQSGNLLDIVFEKGALDAWVTAAHMKKNRTGFEFTVLCQPVMEEELIKCIFLESSTTGLRLQHKKRFLLHREKITLATRWGQVDSKLIIRPGGRKDIVPEFEACKRISKRFNIPLREVYSEIIREAAGWKAK